jgi:hypothetical protein
MDCIQLGLLLPHYSKLTMQQTAWTLKYQFAQKIDQVSRNLVYDDNLNLLWIIMSIIIQAGTTYTDCKITASHLLIGLY